MNEEENNQENQVVPDAELQQELFTPEEYLSIEKSRIEADKQRSEVAMAVVKMTEASDSRLHEYHMSKLEKESQEKREERVSGMKFLWTLFFSGLLFFVFLIFMAFYGDNTQSRLSLNVIKTIFNALGGFGTGLLLLYLFRRLFRR